VIQERVIASRWNSAAITGSAILTADPSKGVRNPARAAIKRTIPLSVLESGGAGVRQMAVTSPVVAGEGFGRSKTGGHHPWHRIP